jgi:hypothetical protein
MAMDDVVDKPQIISRPPVSPGESKPPSTTTTKTTVSRASNTSEDVANNHTSVSSTVEVEHQQEENAPANSSVDHGNAIVSPPRPPPSKTSSKSIEKEDGHGEAPAGEKAVTDEKNHSNHASNSNTSINNTTKPSILRNPIQRLRRRRNHRVMDETSSKTENKLKVEEEEEVKTEQASDEITTSVSGRPQISIVLAHDNEVVVEQLQINKMKSNDFEEEEQFYSPLKLKSPPPTSKKMSETIDASTKGKGIIKTSSGRSYSRSNSSLSGSGSEQGKRRVSFDEKSILKHQNESRLRDRLGRRRNIGDTFRLAMPVILPYIVAIVILIVSSLVPPANETHYVQHDINTQQRQQILSSSSSSSSLNSPAASITTSNYKPSGGLFHFSEKLASAEHDDHSELMTIKKSPSIKTRTKNIVSSIISSSSTESLYQLGTTNKSRKE